MKFIIRRTSDLSDTKTIKEAKKMLVPYWQTRTCTIKYFDKTFSKDEGLFNSKGSGHKEFKVEGTTYCTRQENDKERWMIEINTLEDLLKIEDKYGQIIVSRYDNDDPEIKSPIGELEIYDNYRE